MATAFGCTSVDITHERSRKRVCAVCYRKGNRSISDRDLEAIRMYAVEGFDRENPEFPCGLCNGCHLLLSKRRIDDSVLLPLAEDYDPSRPLNTRSMNTCSCRICVISSSKNHDALSMKKKSGRPPRQPSEERTSFKICGRCFAKIHRGCVHSQSTCH